MSMPLRCLIVDNEPDARQFLRQRLVTHPDLEIVGEAVSLAEAWAFCRTLLPDVVFLDLNMPSAAGLELSALLPVESRPAIVIVTAHEKHALTAFELDAVDYLLKPYPPQRIAATIKKLRARFEGRAALQSAVSPLPRLEAQSHSSIMVRQQNQFFHVNYTDIAVIKTVGDYTRITLNSSKSYLLRQTLKRWDKLLPSHNFFRVDRFKIINLSCVKKVERVSRNKMMIYLMGSQQPKALGRLASIRLVQRLRGRTIV